MPPDTTPTNHPKPAGPLEQRLKAAAAESRRNYLTSGFSRDGYAELASRGKALCQSFEQMGIETDALGFVRDLTGVLESVVKLLDNPKAPVVAPTNDEVYRAGLLIARLRLATANLAGAPKAWAEQFAALIEEIPNDSSIAPRRMALIEFAGMCRAKKIPCRPHHDCVAATVEMDDWSIAVAPELADAPSELASAATRACDTLQSLRRPGLILLDVGGALPDAPRLHRVGNDATAMIEMRRHLDQFIVDHHEEIVNAVDIDFAFGAIISAVLHGVNVSAGRIAFASCTRAVNLCETDDPRTPHLAAFMNRFGA